MYDFQKRISYFRLTNLKSENHVQFGGTINTQESIIYKLNKVELENIILKLLDKEYARSNLLCKYFCHKNKYFM